MPTTAWDRVIAFGWFEKEPGPAPGLPGVPDTGSFEFRIEGAPNGVKRVDGTAIYRSGVVRTVTLGSDNPQDAVARTIIRDAYRAAAEATATALGATFDPVTWNQAWEARLPAFVCTSFYATDDLDITPRGWQVWVTEKLSGGTRSYPIPLTLSMINTTPIPGLNFAAIELPEGTPAKPAPTYARGQANGIATLGPDGKLTADQVPAGLGGGGGGFTNYSQVAALSGYPSNFPPTIGTTGNTAVAGNDTRLTNARDTTSSRITDATATGRSVITAADALAARTAIAAAAASHTHPSTQVTDFTEAVQDAVAELLQGTSGVSLTYDDANNTLLIAGGGTGGAGLDAEAVRDTIGVALLGSANIAVSVNDAADTITITTTATQNSTDAALRDRGSHTGVQPVSSVDGLQALLDGKQPVGNYPTTDGTLTRFVRITQAAYDALGSGRPSTTHYDIVG